jgi:serine protease
MAALVGVAAALVGAIASAARGAVPTRPTRGAAPTRPTRAAPYAPDRIVVGFAPHSSRRAHTAALAGTAADRGPTLGGQSRVVRLAPGVSVARALARLRRRPGVAYAVPDYLAHAAGAFIPDDPGRPGGRPGDWQALQWNFVGRFGVNAPTAWANLIAAHAPGGAGVRVAVLDTGVAYANHGRFLRSPDFYPSQFARGYDFVDDTPHPDDHNGHGTHVAGTIAEATNNGKGLAGLAYGAKIMPVRVLDAHGEGDAATIARGVRFAARHGAQIVNLSLEFSSDVGARDIPELISAIRTAHRRGVLVVGAAGNEGHGPIAYPARAPNVLSIGATTEHGCLSDFSNKGRGLSMVAPGGGSDADEPSDPSCRPLEPPGRDIFQITFAGASPRRFGIPGGYEGTSMAAPHVSATAALIIASHLLGAHPSPGAITKRLIATARRLGSPGYNARYGWGLIDAGAATDPHNRAGLSPG